MSSRKLLLLLAVATLLRAPYGLTLQAKEESSSVAPADNPPTPEAVAKAIAGSKNGARDILVVFNSSDTEGWCGKIRREILAKPEFTAALKDRFTVVALDFPRHTAAPDEERRINAAYARHYGITGYPVLLLLDKNGRPYAKTGYRPGGPAPYAKHLGDLRTAREKRDGLVAKALKNKGDIRVELLASALRSIDASLAGDYGDLFEELRKADPADRHKVVFEYDLMRVIERARAKAVASHNRAAALLEFDSFLAGRPDLPKDRLQRVLLERFAFLPTAGDDGLSRQARHQQRLDQLKAMRELAPGSPLVGKISGLIAEQEGELQKLREDIAPE